MIVTVGIDIGQRVDPTAVVVTEMVWRPTTDPLPGGLAYEDHHIVRHLERLPLNTPYPKIAAYLKDVVQEVEQRVQAGSLQNRAGWLEPQDYPFMTTYVDATGVGKPVVDILAHSGVKTIGVYFTHGDRRQEQTDENSGEFRVILGKAYMVARLQTLLQTHRLHLPDTEEVRYLASELLAYEIRVTEKANDTYGAFTVGVHDDMVTALGLSVNKPPQYVGGMASTDGHEVMDIPDWAGGHMGQVRPQPTLGGGMFQPQPGFGGLNAWGESGGNDYERFRRR